jgi:hypothetical protein
MSTGRFITTHRSHHNTSQHDVRSLRTMTSDHFTSRRLITSHHLPHIDVTLITSQHLSHITIITIKTSGHFTAHTSHPRPNHNLTSLRSTYLHHDVTSFCITHEITSQPHITSHHTPHITIIATSHHFASHTSHHFASHTSHHNLTSLRITHLTSQSSRCHITSHHTHHITIITTSHHFASHTSQSSQSSRCHITSHHTLHHNHHVASLRMTSHHTHDTVITIITSQSSCQSSLFLSAS